MYLICLSTPIGASSGIGAETARILALRGVHVVMAVRNISAGREVQEAIRKEIPNAKVDAMELDLSSSSSIKGFALKFNHSNHPLNLLMYDNSLVCLCVLFSVLVFYLTTCFWLSYSSFHG